MEKKYTDDQIEEILLSGVETEIKAVIGYVYEKADAGDPKFAYMVSSWLWHGYAGVKKNIGKSEVYLDVAVEGLIPEAIYDRAARNREQSIDEKKKALSYYILAAILGDGDAVEAVSDYFLYGEILEKNDFVAGALRKHSNYLRKSD